MKKRICSCFMTFFVLCLTVSISFEAAAFNSMHDQEIKKAREVLIETGWTNEEIDDLLSEEALLEYANVSSIIGSEQKYYCVPEEGEPYEISKTECLSAVARIKTQERIRAITSQNTRTSSDGYITYTVTAHNLNNHKRLVSSRFEWLITPLNRKIDVFALMFNSHLVRDTSFQLYYRYKADRTITTPTGTTYDTYEVTSPTSVMYTTSGVITTQKLYSDSPMSPAGYSTTATNHRGYMQYRVQTATNNVTTGYIVSYYFHQQTTVQVIPSISWTSVPSVSITPASSFKPMLPNVDLSFSM